MEKNSRFSSSWKYRNPAWALTVQQHPPPAGSDRYRLVSPPTSYPNDLDAVDTVTPPATNVGNEASRLACGPVAALMYGRARSGWPVASETA